MNLKDLEKIIEILRHSDVNEFELEQEGTTIRITRGQIVQAQPAVPAVAPIPQATTVMVPAAAPTVMAAPVAAEQKIDSGLVKVESPIVGTFYSKPAPDAAVFVQVGNRVKKGDTLCIVEAMKLMNEIESPADGIIEKMLLTDGQVVEFGEVLFLIRP
jgi:acetyl-CoA carboxylase biotin carboxyl carrier protein